ncbi:MAG: FecR family protein [Candidatus Omnitrophota bacterium]
MRRVLGIIVFVLGIAVVSFFLYQNSRIREEEISMAAGATILFMKGDVCYMTSGGDKYLKAVPGVTLLEGYRMETGRDSWAEVGFDEEAHNVAKIYENTMVSFKSVGSVELGLLKGKVRALVEKLDEGSNFKVKTPTAICGARGTGWDIQTDGLEVIVEVHENKVYLKKLPHEGYVEELVIIDAGSRVHIIDLKKPIVTEDLDPKKREDWVRWKKDFKERLKPLAKVPSNVSDTPDGHISKDDGKRVWVEKSENGDFQLMVTTEDEEEAR